MPIVFGWKPAWCSNCLDCDWATVYFASIILHDLTVHSLGSPAWTGYYQPVHAISFRLFFNPFRYNISIIVCIKYYLSWTRQQLLRQIHQKLSLNLTLTCIIAIPARTVTLCMSVIFHVQKNASSNKEMDEILHAMGEENARLLSGSSSSDSRQQRHRSVSGLRLKFLFHTIVPFLQSSLSITLFTHCNSCVSCLNVAVVASFRQNHLVAIGIFFVAAREQWKARNFSADHSTWTLKIGFRLCVGKTAHDDK